MTRPRLSARRDLQTGDADFVAQLGEFDFDPESTETPRRIIRKPGRFEGSKIHAKFSEDTSPDDVMEIHCYGFHAAHARRRRRVQATFDKQWADEVRARPFVIQKVGSNLDPVRKPKDQHVLERVLHEREEEKMADRCLVELPPKPLDRRLPLPREEKAFERFPRPVYWL
jgi:hypothetical protein